MTNWKHFETHQVGVAVHVPLTPAIRRQRPEDVCEFKAKPDLHRQFQARQSYIVIQQKASKTESQKHVRSFRSCAPRCSHPAFTGLAATAPLEGTHCLLENQVHLLQGCLALHVPHVSLFPTLTSSLLQTIEVKETQ